MRQGTARPKFIPTHCERPGCGGRVVISEEYDGWHEWYCLTCGKRYIPFEERELFLKLNAKVILNDLATLGETPRDRYLNTLKKYPIKGADIRRLKEENAEMWKEMLAETGQYRVRVPQLPVGNPGRNELPLLPPFSSKWDGESSKIWLRLLEKMWDKENGNMRVLIKIPQHKAGDIKKLTLYPEAIEMHRADGRVINFAKVGEEQVRARGKAGGAESKTAD